MSSIKRAALAAAVVLATSAGMAQAGSYQISVQTGLTSGNGFQALPTSTPFSGTPATASFTYTGQLNFNNSGAQNQSVNPLGDLNSSFGFSAANISGYSGTGTVTFNSVQVADFGSVSSFLASSGSVANYRYGSLYTIILGALASGTNLVINHDDGISLFRNGTRVTGGIAGPTGLTTATFTNLAEGAYTLYYSRQNGTPSILQVAVPEPASLALFGAGLLGLAAVRRRKAAKKA